MAGLSPGLASHSSHPIPHASWDKVPFLSLRLEDLQQPGAEGIGSAVEPLAGTPLPAPSTGQGHGSVTPLAGTPSPPHTH